MRIIYLSLLECRETPENGMRIKHIKTLCLLELTIEHSCGLVFGSGGFPTVEMDYAINADAIEEKITNLSGG